MQGDVRDLVLTDVDISGVSNRRGTGNHAYEGVGAVAGDLRGTLTNVTVLSGRITSSNIAGGLVGEVYGDDSVFIKDSSSAASVNVSFSGGDSFAHRVFAGGLVGKVNTSACETGPDGPDIRTSYSTGSIIVSISDSEGIRPSVGGLVGTLVAGTCGGDIIDSYSSSSIDITLNNAETNSEGLFIGGLTGRTYESEIRNSYAVGQISYTVIGSQPTIKVGGLVGDGSTRDSVSDSYWDKEATTITTSSLGSGKTTSELQTPISSTGIYANWSSSIWNYGSSSQYPQLVKE